MPAVLGGTVPCAGAKVALPNSMNEFCPEKPCQPSLLTHGGSMRPGRQDRRARRGAVRVERTRRWADHCCPARLQSICGAIRAGAIHCAGNAQVVGTETFSAVFAMFAAIAELPQGTVGEFAGAIRWAARVVHHVSAGVLVAGGKGLDHVPAEQREIFS